MASSFPIGPFQTSVVGRAAPFLRSLLLVQGSFHHRVKNQGKYCYSRQYCCIGNSYDRFGTKRKPNAYFQIFSLEGEKINQVLYLSIANWIAIPRKTTSMRIERLAFTWFLVLVQNNPTHCFVTKSVNHGVFRSQVWSSSVLESIDSSYTNEVKSDEGLVRGEEMRPSTLDYTSRILDTEKNPPGSLTKELIRVAYPLLLSWGRAETAEGAAIVERLINRLEDEYNAGNKMFVPNSSHYTIAVDAWGKSRHEDSAKNAERILMKMNEMKSKTPRVAPTRVTYNAVMNAHAKQGNTSRAADILEMMENNPSIQPLTNDYNVLLGSYARLGEPRKAELVLNRMANRCKSLGHPCVCAPDLYSYNMLLDAWAKSDEAGRGRRAEDILQALQTEYDQGRCDFSPDARTYSAAICAIVRSNEMDSIQRAEALLLEAQSKGIVPDEYLHSSLLDAYASSTKRGSAEKAEELLGKLEADGVAYAIAYNTVLKAWKGSESEDAAPRAEAILKRMEQRGFADTISYCTVIAAYANKGDKSSAVRAEEILKSMQEAGAKPNTPTLNAGESMRGKRVFCEEFADEIAHSEPIPLSYECLDSMWRH